MKKLVSRILIAGLALTGLFAAQAQDRTITANIPFGFYMGANAMPAGAYQVTELARGTLVVLRSRGAVKSIGVSQVSSKSSDEAPRLVFHRYGDTYFLSEIWNANGYLGLHLATTQSERELANSGTAPVVAVIRLASE